MTITIRLPYHTESYTVDTDTASIADDLRGLYGAYCSDAADGSIFLSVTASSGSFTVSGNGGTFVTADPMGCIHNIIYRTKRIEPGIFAMHAGAVCRNGKATVFAASTTTGKTTLISYLIGAGLEYVSDDCVFFGMNDLAVHPFHNPVHLREGGADILRKCGRLPEGLIYADERYVFMPRSLSPGTMELERVYFIERTANENSVIPLERKDAFSRLMFSPITSYDITPEYMRFLGRLAPFCSALRYSDMDYVLAQIV